MTFLGGGGDAPYTSSEVAGGPGGAGTLAVDFSKLDDAATSDPRVGMLGGSYGGQIQFATAATDSRVDTLFNLQEAVATYQGLKARKVPVSMAWQSWGHSGGMSGNPGAAPGELDLTGTHIEDTYLGLRIKNWFDHYLKDVASAPTGPEFSFFRDWVEYTGTATPAYGTASSYPVGTPRSYYLYPGAGHRHQHRRRAHPGCDLHRADRRHDPDDPDDPDGRSRRAAPGVRQAL